MTILFRAIFIIKILGDCEILSNIAFVLFLASYFRTLQNRFFFSLEL